jgi:hypothetical protein
LEEKTMGHTHYWRNHGGIDAAEWAKAIADCDKIVAASKDEFELDVETDGPNVWFNGNAEKDHDHETFAVPRNPENLQAFDFCKTAQKPYDAPVVACLARLAEAGLVVGSDGDEADWEEGLALGAKILGRPLTFPVKD